jgi:ABC-2 type transport system permease protein
MPPKWRSLPVSEQSGSIYDLGYRRYQGARLGRGHAIQTLFSQSLRAAYGLGRRPSSKIAPIVLAIVALTPAVIQLGVAAIFPSDELEAFRLEEYFGLIQVILALFVAAVAPELVGRDLRNRTLSLYFSRPLSRSDYAIAKLTAMSVAVALLSVFPMLVMFFGNAMASTGTVDYLKDNWREFPRIVSSGTLVALTFSALSLVIAAQTPRRSYATGGIIALFVLSSAIGNILAETAGSWWRFLSIFDVTDASTRWIFGVGLGETEFDGVNNAGPLCTVFLGLLTAGAAGLLLRRYGKVSA